VNDTKIQGSEALANIDNNEIKNNGAIFLLFIDDKYIKNIIKPNALVEL